MNILDHHIYEYKKGVRDLILWTVSSQETDEAVKRLERSGIAYHVSRISQQKVNIYFGAGECLNIIRSFGEKPLNQLTLEEDFMLGIMLGYSRTQQYKRYWQRKSSQQNVP